MDWKKILHQFIWDRYIEDGNFVLIRSNFKLLSDAEFRELNVLVEEIYADYQNLKGA